MWRRCNRTNVRSFGGSTPETQWKETKSTAGTSKKTLHFPNFPIILSVARRSGNVRIPVVRNLLESCRTLEPDGVVDEVQDVSDCVVLAHLHLLTVC